MKFEQYLIEKEVEKVKKELKDGDDYLKAPNGKKSNLPEKQWLLVRTKSFKKWFGDWENDAPNSSKIIDKNGEPMIVYHVSDVDGIEEFKASWRGIIFFATTLEGANRGTIKGNNVTYQAFLNVRTPRGSLRSAIYFGDAESKKYQERIKKNGNDGIFIRDEAKGSIAVFQSNQIKSINNTKFTTSNNINENVS